MTAWFVLPPSLHAFGLETREDTPLKRIERMTAIARRSLCDFIEPSIRFNGGIFAFAHWFVSPDALVGKWQVWCWVSLACVKEKRSVLA